jgi:hypothetical protein
VTRDGFAGETLAVQVAAGGGSPERLLLLERPVEGRVRVREWTSADWSRPATPRDRGVAEVLDELRRADAARRIVGIEMYRVRLWLEGGGAAS